ncbi:hypothetical protein [Mesorhizobium tianshanense]|nr:hypothetical protein [Mesorhizobium tianshanense]
MIFAHPDESMSRPAFFESDIAAFSDRRVAPILAICSIILAITFCAPDRIANATEVADKPWIEQSSYDDCSSVCGAATALQEWVVALGSHIHLR